jgi:sugar/nucleoside kinase (ribokinase family)
MLIKVGVTALPQARFDVICAGEAFALWHGGAQTALALRPGGGAVNAALALARRGVRVALATILPDDRMGRALRTRIEEAGVDVRGVDLALPRRAVVLATSIGVSAEVASHDTLDASLAVPDHWTSDVLLVSGLTPIVADAAALCRAARAGRRRGAIVVVDVNARWQAWAGHDARAVRMILREADVVRVSTRDLATLDLDEASIRLVARPQAVLVVTNEAGDACATGVFGEVTARAAGGPHASREGAGFIAAICAALARAADPSVDRAHVWQRILDAER